MKNIKIYARSLIFLIGLAVIFIGIDFLCARDGYTDYLLRNVNSDTQDYDTVIIGASHAKVSTNPVLLDQNADTCSINMAISGETVKDSFYLLEETCRNNDVKTVILDIDYQYYFNPPREGFYSESFFESQIRWSSPVKWQYTLENLQYLDVRNTFTRGVVCSYEPAEICVNVKQKLSKSYKEADIASLDSPAGTYIDRGYFYMNPVNALGGQDVIDRWKDRSNECVRGYPLRYLNRIIKYCRDNDIDLICVTSPITPSSIKKLHMENVHSTINAILEKNNVPYYDFNMTRLDILPREDEDFIDYEGHMNGEFAKEYSALLGQIIKKHNNDIDVEKYFYSSYDQLYENLMEN